MIKLKQQHTVLMCHVARGLGVLKMAFIAAYFISGSFQFESNLIQDP